MKQNRQFCVKTEWREGWFLGVWIALKNYQLSSGCQETELMQMTNQEG